MSPRSRWSPSGLPAFRAPTDPALLGTPIVPGVWTGAPASATCIATYPQGYLRTDVRSTDLNTGALAYVLSPGQVGTASTEATQWRILKLC